jgi:uncharacterized protein YkwD
MQVRKAMSLHPQQVRDGHATEIRHMDRPRIFCLVLLLAAMVPLVAYSQPSAAAFGGIGPTTPSGGSSKLAMMERRTFDLVNQERIRNGTKPLRWIDQAAAAAREHSENMAELQYFSHADLLGNRVDKRADVAGIGDWRQIGENIAWMTGQSDPASHVVSSWMGSPGHRENLLNPKYEESGIGIAVTSDGQYYFTQVFVHRR